VRKVFAALAAMALLVGIGLLFFYLFEGTPSENKCDLVYSDGRRACP
jgi:hypothetical protein